MGVATEDAGNDKQCVSFIETDWLSPVSFEDSVLLQTYSNISEKSEIVVPSGGSSPGAQVPNFHSPTSSSLIRVRNQIQHGVYPWNECHVIDG